MNAHVFSLRIPRAWAGRLDSESVRHWLAEFLRQPTPNLPPDPGAGTERISLSLPKRAVKVVSGLLDESESAALRRIIAGQLGALPVARAFFALPAAQRRALPRPRATRLLPAPVPQQPCTIDPRLAWSLRQSGVESSLSASEEAMVSVEEEPESWKRGVALLWGLLLAGFIIYCVVRWLISRSAPAIAAKAAAPAFLPWVPKR